MPKLSSYGESELNGSGYTIETWAGNLFPKQVSGKINSPSNEYHCVNITNERPSSMDVTCEGDDSQGSLKFEVKSNCAKSWKKTYVDISPEGDTGDTRKDKGARIYIDPDNEVDETKIRIICNLKWKDGVSNSGKSGFNVRLS